MQITVGQSRAGTVYPDAALWDYSLGGRILADPKAAYLAPYDGSQLVLYTLVLEPDVSYEQLPMLDNSPLEVELIETGENAGYVRATGIAWASPDATGTIGDVIAQQTNRLRGIEWGLETVQFNNLRTGRDGRPEAHSNRWKTLLGSAAPIKATKQYLVDTWESITQASRDLDAWWAKKAEEIEQKRDDALDKLTAPFEDAYNFAAEEAKSIGFLLFAALLIALVVHNKTK